MNQIEQMYAGMIVKDFLNCDFSGALWLARAFYGAFPKVTTDFIRAIAEHDGDWDLGSLTTILPLLPETLEAVK